MACVPWLRKMGFASNCNATYSHSYFNERTKNPTTITPTASRQQRHANRVALQQFDQIIDKNCLMANNQPNI
jgi:hypothetical protein